MSTEVLRQKRPSFRYQTTECMGHSTANRPIYGGGYLEMADTNMKDIPKVGCCFSSESHHSSEGCPADSGGALFAVKRGRDGRKEGVAWGCCL